MEPLRLFRTPFGLVLALIPLGVLVLPAGTPEPGSKTGEPGPRQLHREAVASYEAFPSYIARFVRREPPQHENDEEILTFYFRKKPWSVRFKWLQGAGQGREVLYVQGQHEDKLHIVVAPGDVPLLPGGSRMALPISSPLVKRASRTPITESGIGALIDRFGKVLDACERGDYSHGRMTVLGTRQRPDSDEPLTMVEQSIPARSDPDVPGGGRRLIGFHPRLHLPVLAVLSNEQGQEVDYYRFDRLQLDVQLDDMDFDPGRLSPRAAPEKKGVSVPPL